MVHVLNCSTANAAAIALWDTLYRVSEKIEEERDRQLEAIEVNLQASTTVLRARRRKANVHRRRGASVQAMIEDLAVVKEQWRCAIVRNVQTVDMAINAAISPAGYDLPALRDAMVARGHARFAVDLGEAAKECLDFTEPPAETKKSVPPPPVVDDSGRKAVLIRELQKLRGTTRKQAFTTLLAALAAIDSAAANTIYLAQLSTDATTTITCTGVAGFQPSTSASMGATSTNFTVGVSRSIEEEGEAADEDTPAADGGVLAK